MIPIRGLVIILATLPALPDASEADYLPPVAYIHQMLLASQQYMAHLEARYAVASWLEKEEIWAAHGEATTLHRVWSTMGCALDGYSDECRRQALYELRELVGDESYLAHDWPPPVPLWRFHFIFRTR